jgi:hypothetical protein
MEAVKRLVTLLLERLQLCGNVRITLPVLLKTLPILLLLLPELLELGFPRLALLGGRIQLTLEAVQESFRFRAFLLELGFPVTELLKAAVQLLERALELRAFMVCRKGVAFRLVPFLRDLLQRGAEPLFLGKFSSKALLGSTQRFFCLLELLCEVPNALDKLRLLCLELLELLLEFAPDLLKPLHLLLQLPELCLETMQMTFRLGIRLAGWFGIDLLHLLAKLCLL